MLYSSHVYTQQNTRSRKDCIVQQRVCWCSRQRVPSSLGTDFLCLLIHASRQISIALSVQELMIKLFKVQRVIKLFEMQRVLFLLQFCMLYFSSPQKLSTNVEEHKDYTRLQMMNEERMKNRRFPLLPISITSLLSST